MPPWWGVFGFSWDFRRTQGTWRVQPSGMGRSLVRVSTEVGMTQTSVPPRTLPLRRYGAEVSIAKLRIIRHVAPEVFAGIGPKGGLLAPPAAVVVPVSLVGGVLTVFAYPAGTAVKVDQAAAPLRQALAERGATVDEIVTVEVGHPEILLAQATADLDARLAKLEGPA